MRRANPADSGRALSAARAIVETGGVDALSMRKLAAELGVAHTAIYWHVGGRDELVAAIIDAFLADLGDITPRGRTPRQRMASVAREIHTQVVQHRALVALAMEQGRFPGMWFPAQVALAREVTAAGLKGTEAARAVTSLLYHRRADARSRARGARRRRHAIADLWNGVEDPMIDRACGRTWPRDSTRRWCLTTRGTVLDAVLAKARDHVA